MKTKKKFDCVEIKQLAQERINKETEGMSWEQERDYLRQEIESGPLAEKWKEIQIQQANRIRAKKGAA